jgi:anti-sigma B factor antagonist
MKINQSEHGDVLVVAVEDPRIDAARAPAFKDAMAERIDQGHVRLVLDLSRVDFVDSSGLGAIVSCLKRVGPRGSLAVAGARGAVAKLFTLTRMDRVFPMHASVDDALKSAAS